MSHVFDEVNVVVCTTTNFSMRKSVNKQQSQVEMIQQSQVEMIQRAVTGRNNIHVKVYICCKHFKNQAHGGFHLQKWVPLT